MEPVKYHPVQLDVDEAPTGHEFAHPHWYAADRALLNYLLQDLRVLVRRAFSGELSLSAYESHEWDVHGLRRRTVICDPEGLLESVDVQIVGFFGERRSSQAAAMVDIAELDVIGEFRSYPGIMSYSSVELIGNQWANLVVHRQPTDRQAWRESHVHIRAAEELAPEVYHNVRIHNGCIVGGPIGSGTVIIESTKYWDYDCGDVWHATRYLTTN